MIVRFLATNQIKQGLKFNWICSGLSSMDSATADKYRRLPASKEIRNKLSGIVADNHLLFFS